MSPENVNENLNENYGLKVQNLTMRFGGLLAVDKFHMEIGKSELVGVIGPNGAGKTTIFNMITGMYVPTEGQVFLHQKDITGLKPYLITQRGMARTFQNIRLFKDLSVLDNIRLAGHFRLKYDLTASLFRTRKFKDEEEFLINEARELLKIFGLEKKESDLARNLPYGEQRRLEIARALASHPKILLLDEPAAGMNPNATKELTHLIRFVRDQFKISIILIEHDMQLVMNVCEKIHVVDHGVKIAEGNPKQIQSNAAVVEAYLGAQE